MLEDISAADYVVLRGLLTGILEAHLQGPVPEPKQLKTAETGLSDAHRRWLRLLDMCAAPEALRAGVESRSPDDASLIVLLRFLMRMGREVDHDRFDWVITYIFKRRMDAGGSAAIGQQIMEMFPEFPQPPLSDLARQQMATLEAALQQIKSFTGFSELTRSGLIAKGREVKESFHEERFHPAVLGAVVNYNIVLSKAFRGLFDEAAGRSRELAAKLTASDYRSNVEQLRKLAEAPPVAPSIRPGDESLEFELEDEVAPLAMVAAAAASATPATPAPVVRGPMIDPVKELGLDEGREAFKLRFTMRSMIAFLELPENRAAIVVKAGNFTLPLADWEARSLQTNYPDDDKSFRAEFARLMKDTAALMMRMAEEIDALEKKASSEFLWKPHYDALVWLFVKGRDQVADLQRFADATGRRGLPEKQQQVAKTATRLVAALEKVAKSF